MKKALLNTKVTVKLRRSRYKEEWYLIIESYPVYKRGSNRASRVVESINRTISTPVWDKLEKPRDFDPFGQTGFAHLWLQYDCPFKVLVLGVNFILPF